MVDGQATEVTPGIAVVGSGYVGTVVAACLAMTGQPVVGVEVDPAKLASLRGGRAPFHEPGLDEILAATLAAGSLRFTDDTAEALGSAGVVFLCVGTPMAPDGGVDMTYVAAAARNIGAALGDHHVLVTKSTVPIGSGHWLVSLIEDARPAGDGRSVSVVSNPEFLREGRAVQDFLFPDRVVIGSDDPAALERVRQVYRPVLEQSFTGANPDCHPVLVTTSLATAETVKYASNAFLATKISFINEIANLCDLVGADVTEVARALGLDPRIGGAFLDAGVGWGGSCFGKDLSGLISTAEQYGYEATLLKATVRVNVRQRALVVDRLRRRLKILQGRRIALLGLAFKPGTDDLRDAPALDIATALMRAGAIVTAHDPLVRETPGCPGLRFAAEPYAAAERADAVVLVTEWPDYLALDYTKLAAQMRGTLVVDGRNVLDHQAIRAAGLDYEGIGRQAADLPAR